MMKWLNLRNLILIISVAVIFLLLSLMKPIAESEIKKIIAQEVLKYEDIENFDLSDIKLGFLPPNIKFQKAELKLKKYPELKKILVEEARIYPELIRLLSFEFKLKDIYVRGLDLNIEDTSQKNNKTDFKFKYEDIEALPLSSLYVEDSHIRYNSTYLDLGYFNIRKRWNSIEIHSDLNKLRIEEDVPELNINRLALEIRKNNTRLKQLAITSGESNLQLGFDINKPFNEKLLQLNIIESTDIRLSSKINLSNFKFLFENYLDLKVKNLSGLAQILVYKSALKKTDEIEFTLEAENLAYDTFYAEEISSNGHLSMDDLKFNFLKLNNKNFVFETKNLNIKKRNNIYTTYSKGKVESMELGDFLETNLHLGDIPIHMPTSLDFFCNGPIYPNPELKCDVEGHIQSLHIWGDSKRPDASTIVKLPESKLKGTATLLSKKMFFNTSHEFKNSQVSFEGDVDYVKGFNVAYRSDFFNFSDLTSLANIPLKGFGHLEGHTRGSARWGEFNIKTDISDFEFFDYQFGKVISDVSYKNQHLYFENTRSVIGDSLLNATIDFSLKNMLINIEAESQKASVKDILFAIQKIAEPPIYLSGEGPLSVKASGPLDLGKMTYDIKGKFHEGLIHVDRYRDLEINIVAEKGQVKTNNSLFYLGDKINIAGTVDPHGMVDIIAMGDSINLSRATAIKNLGVELSGLAQIQVHLTDFILLPIVNGKFKSTNFIDGYNQLGDSFFDFVIHKNYSEVSGSLFNQTLNGDAYVPHSTEGKFKIEMDLNKLDPFKFMSLFDSKISKVGSNTEISGKVNISAPFFQLEKMNGHIHLTEALFKAERTRVSLKEPVSLKVVKGLPSGDFDLVDHNDNSAHVSLSEKRNRIHGLLALGFLRTLIPNVEEIQGELELDTEFTFLPYFKFTKGYGHIKNLSLKIENLIHSFRDLDSDLEFINQDIKVQSLKGFFANGHIHSRGKVYFSKGIGVDLEGDVERLNLNIPEGFKSIVSGNYYFKGVGFPYTLGGDFKILEGTFEMEFEGSSSEQYTVLPSQLLPKSKSIISALDLNINVKNIKPIAINNSYIEGFANAQLNIQGEPTLPIMKGQIRLTNDSKLIFQSNEFKVNSGLVTFNSVSPEQGALNLDANARIKDFADLLEREYDIRMLIQGTGNNPLISFSSQPHLSESQILSFLAFGVMENNSLNKEISLGDQQAQTGYQIGGIFLKNRFAKDIQDRLGLHLNFTSSYENQDVSPKIIVEKKFNSKFSLSGSRTLGAFQKNTVRGEYKINKKLSIIGLYENYDLDNQANLNRARLVDGTNVLGMDLQYNIEFE